MYIYFNKDLEYLSTYNTYPRCDYAKFMYVYTVCEFVYVYIYIGVCICVRTYVCVCMCILEQTVLWIK